MTEYVTRVYLEVDGQNIDDIKSVSEPETEHFKAVNTMHGTGVAEMVVRYSPITVEYLIPETRSEFDWAGVRNGRLTIERTNGDRFTYTGVYPLKIGEAKADGENEMVRTIELCAMNKIEE